MKMFKSLIFTVCFTVSFTSLAEDELSLSLEELLDVEVTSVSKQGEPLSNSPAAIYVVTNDDIVRSGATSIPQALRDVPGLHVAKIGSQRWAVSSRGFNGRFNNKLLVLLDGRAVYSPVFSGVYWETLDTLMSDIERIEVIRGPSAAIWGANAVNGVINIITKHSADTLGGYAELGTGDYEKGFAGFRYGSKLSNSTTARVYAKSFERDPFLFEESDIPQRLHALTRESDFENAWGQNQLGGRIDVSIDSTSSLLLSADTYQNDAELPIGLPVLASPYLALNENSVEAEGWNLLAHYTKALSADSEYSLKIYYDYMSREDQALSFTTDTFDIDFQHQRHIGRQNIVWGLGYRYIKDDVQNNTILQFNDASTETQLWSGFVRDEIMLLKNTLWLTLATRLEHNDYTGVEWQPNVRLMWQIDEKSKLWSSIAHAVRTPSHVEREADIYVLTVPANLLTMTPPVKAQIEGNDGYQSETMTSYELGYRFSPTPHFSIDSTIFYNEYDDLRSVNLGEATYSPDSLPIPNYLVASTPFKNEQQGSNFGVELSSQWLVSDTFKVKFNYGFTHNDFALEQAQNTDAPKHIASLNTDWLLDDDVSINMTWRYVEKTDSIGLDSVGGGLIDSYQSVDLGVNWQIMQGVKVSLYGKDLFLGSHIEYRSEFYTLPYRIEPSFYGKVSIDF